MQEQNDARLLRLKAWVDVVLGGGDWQWQALCNDASFRRYFRICLPREQYVLMDAPPTQEDVRPFLAVAAQLLDAGVHVPVVHHADVSQGFLVLSDLGDQTYLQALCARRDDAAFVDDLYMRAMQVLGVLASLPQVPPDISASAMNPSTAASTASPHTAASAMNPSTASSDASPCTATSAASPCTATSAASPCTTVSAASLHTTAFDASPRTTPTSVIASPRSGRGDPLPPFDQTLLDREWHLFEHWYLDQHLGRAAQVAAHRQALDVLFQTLSARVLEQPRCWVHRDFHSRNLMVLPDGGVGVLDFQDAVWGPVTYDVISLLRDAYIAWPEKRVTQWLCTLHHMLPQLDGVNETQWLCWTDWMSVQRHLKVLGIFARLALRDGKRQYLDDMPLVRQYVMAMVPKYPELAVLNALL